MGLVLFPSQPTTFGKPSSLFAALLLPPSLYLLFQFHLVALLGHFRSPLSLRLKIIPLLPTLLLPPASPECRGGAESPRCLAAGLALGFERLEKER